MKYLDIGLTILIIFFAVYYIYRKFINKPSNSACLGCPYAENGACSLHKDNGSEKCDINGQDSFKK